MKIFYVSITANKDGCKMTVKEFEAKESKSVLIINKVSGFGGKTTHIKKSELMKIDAMIREDLYFLIQRYTWCVPEDLQLAKDKVFSTIKDTAQKQANASNTLLSHILKLHL